MQPWQASDNRRGPAPSRPAGFGPSSSSPSGAAPSSSSSTATAAAATPAPALAPALAPAANGARGYHRCPHCHKMGSHRPEECRSAPQNIVLPAGTVVFGPGATVADLTAVLSGMRQRPPQAGPHAGVKKSRRRRGRKPGQKAKDAGRKPEHRDPGAGGAGAGDGMVPV